MISIIGTKFTTLYNQSLPVQQNRQPSFRGSLDSFERSLCEAKYSLPPHLLEVHRMCGKTIGERIILEAIDKGYIDENKIKKVCDFGCGLGGATDVMRETFKLDKNNITGVDMINIQGNSDRFNFVHGDGIDYLASGKEKFDLIAATYFSPNVNPHELLAAVPNSLSENGQFLAYSDSDTMHKLAKYLKGAEYHRFNDDRYIGAIVIGKVELEKLLAQAPQISFIEYCMAHKA